ncbi:MAG: alpha/beta fold hydrolase [Betaproteobacteria bacterium]|nr:alpha/beta fold hydrolase [Betaproteobacteria bacterium]
MRPRTRRVMLPGPAGRIECAIDEPEEPARGIALVAHPHPLHGGTLDNKVVQTLARALIELGYVALRPNFRGVGASEGSHDAGRGEVDDLAAALAYAQQEFGAGKPVLAGFSFGAAMQTRLAARVAPERLLLVGLAVKRIEVGAVPVDTLVIHGERDETVPLADVLDWARPLDQPVIVVPGTDHFFHGKLNVLRGIVRSNWRLR